MPIIERCFKNPIGADDVCLDEIGRAIDGTVDVGLRRQVYDGVDSLLAEKTGDRRLVSNVEFLEPVVRMIDDRLQRGRIAGLGELVDVDDPPAPIADEIAAHSRANEAGTARDKNPQSH